MELLQKPSFQKEELSRVGKGQQRAQEGSWPSAAFAHPPYPLASLTVLAAGSIQLDDMWMVDLFQEVELRKQVS